MNDDFIRIFFTLAEHICLILHCQLLYAGSIVFVSSALTSDPLYKAKMNYGPGYECARCIDPSRC